MESYLFSPIRNAKQNLILHNRKDPLLSDLDVRPSQSSKASAIPPSKAAASEEPILGGKFPTGIMAPYVS